MKGTFPESADATLDKVRATYATREGEYGDSYHLDNQTAVFLKPLLRRFGVDLSPTQLRLVQLATMIDVKLQRLGGPFKEDTTVDLIAYLSVYNELRSQYEASKTAPNPSPTAGASQP